MAKLTAIDLFAGCGGLMEGFEQSGGFETLACVEWEKAPCENLEHRLKTKWKHSAAAQEVVRFDIRRTSELFNGFADSEFGISKGLDDLVGGRKIDVIIGGPPCQAYSLAGRIRDEHGMRNDYRNYLFESYLEVVKRYKPDFFLFENVVGMLSAAPDGQPIAEKIYSAFKDAGYETIGDFRKAVFSLADYGVPQNRKRIIILGVRKNTFGSVASRLVDEFYSNIMPSFKCRKKTVKDAIGDLPRFLPHIENGKVRYSLEGSREVPNHMPRHHSERDLKVFKLLTEDIESGRMEYVSIERLKELYTEVTGKKSNIHKYYVLRNDQQSNTIPAHLHKDGFRHIHPDSAQCRSLTVREAARIQTFPDDWTFRGSMGDQFKMIGNAVPPAFAKILADALIRLYAEQIPERLPSGFSVNRETCAYPDTDAYEQMLLALDRGKAKYGTANIDTEPKASKVICKKARASKTVLRKGRVKRS